MAQRIPLPLTVSCFSKIKIGFTFLVLAHQGSPGQRAVKRVCVYWWKVAVVVLTKRFKRLCFLQYLCNKQAGRDVHGATERRR